MLALFGGGSALAVAQSFGIAPVAGTGTPTTQYCEAVLSDPGFLPGLLGSVDRRHEHRPRRSARRGRSGGVAAQPRSACRAGFAAEVPALLGRSYPEALPVQAFRQFSAVELDTRPQGLAGAVLIAASGALATLGYAAAARRLAARNAW